MPRESKAPPPGPGSRSAGAPSTETAAQALERARLHARRAVGEALAAARALLDAAALGWSGRPSQAHTSLRTIAELLDEQAARFAGGRGAVPAPMLDAMLEALDQEIERWERRATTDPDARAVLRTFLGLREIFWELGLRRDEPEDAKGAAARPRRQASRKGRGKPAGGPRRPGRVQRVDVQG